MTKKLNNDILSDFMKKMDLDKNDSSRFFDVFQEVFEEALMRDKIVKIGGLGTFKLVEVDARKSVDVNTGEEIEIAGHYKLNFVPEGAVRDLVNKPLDYLETVELDDDDNDTVVEASDVSDTASVSDIPSVSSFDETADPLKKLTEQALELKDILNDINSLGVTASNSASVDSASVSSESVDSELSPEEKKDEFVIEEEVVQKTDASVKEPDAVVVSVPEPVVTDEVNQVVGTEMPSADENESEQEVVVIPSAATEDKDNEEAAKEPDDADARKELLSAMNVIDEEELRRKKGLDLQSDKAIVDSINSENGKSRSNATVGWIVVAIILFVTILALIFYQNIDLFAEKFSHSDALSAGAEQPQTESVAEDIRINESDSIDVIEVQGDTLVETTLDVDTASWLYSPDFSDLFNSTRVYTEFIDTVVLNEGSRLTWISLQQYGHKDFWVYIYEANRDIIGDPNRITVGTSVRIPRVDEKLIDASNPECVRYARYLHDVYVKKTK